MQWPGTDQEWSTNWTWDEGYSTEDQSWDEQEDWQDETTWSDQDWSSWNNWQEEQSETQPASQGTPGYCLVAALKPGDVWESEDQSEYITRDDEGYLYAQYCDENGEWQEGYIDEEGNWLEEEDAAETDQNQSPLNQDGSQTQQ